MTRRLEERERTFAGRCHARRLGRRVLWYDRVESTQAVGRELAAGDEPEGTVIVADEQTAGRGRDGSHWYSPTGAGVWASLLLRPTVPVERAAGLTVIAARAVREMLEYDFCVPAALKEPNDVLVGGRKICGILAESSSLAGRDRLDWLVLGIGLDLCAEFPPELAGIATSLHHHLGTVPSVEDVLARFLERFEELYAGSGSAGSPRPPGGSGPSAGS